MIIHIAPCDSAGSFFRRVAREKPPTLLPVLRGCYWCGQDHRGPIEYWPEDEAERHRRAVRAARDRGDTTPAMDDFQGGPTAEGPDDPAADPRRGRLTP